MLLSILLCSIIKVSILGRIQSIIASYCRMNYTTEPAAVYGHSAHFLVGLPLLEDMTSAFDLVATMLDFHFRLGGKIFSVAPLLNPENICLVVEIAFLSCL